MRAITGGAIAAIGIAALGACDPAGPVTESGTVAMLVSGTDRPFKGRRVFRFPSRCADPARLSAWLSIGACRQVWSEWSILKRLHTRAAQGGSNV